MDIELYKGIFDISVFLTACIPIIYSTDGDAKMLLKGGSVVNAGEETGLSRIISPLNGFFLGVVACSITWDLPYMRGI